MQLPIPAPAEKHPELRVLYFIDSLSPGGAEQSLVTLAPHLRARGIFIEVAYLRQRAGLEANLQTNGVRLHSLAGSEGRLGWVRRAVSLVRERQPDLIHTTLFEADLVGRVASAITRVPVVSSLVNVAYGLEQLEDPRLHRWRVRAAQLADALTARRVVRFHAVTRHVAEVMSVRLRLTQERIEVIPRGRDPELLGVRTPERRIRTRSRIEIGPTEQLVLVVARQEYQKGIDLVLEAFRQVLHHLPDAWLLVAGREGGATPVLRSVVSRLALDQSVIFLGPRHDVPDLLSAADVFVLASRWEGLAGVLLEAMALEAPIVASDLPPVREIVGDREMAQLVAPGDTAALAGAIVAVLGDAEGSAGRASRARVRFLEEFTADRIADRMAGFYGRAIGALRVRSAGERLVRG
jgi:glycosyltransferase involved in cell wall biosynthesis